MLQQFKENSLFFNNVQLILLFLIVRKLLQNMLSAIVIISALRVKF